MNLSTTLVLLLLPTTFADNIFYMKARKALSGKDACHTLGVRRKLDTDEEKANEKFRQYKYEELDEGLIDNNKLLARQHFFRVENQISKSKVFNVIKMFPKAALLHGHGTALLSTKKLFQLINRFEDNLYICIENNNVKARYFTNPDKTCSWLLLKDWRDKNGTFDLYLKSHLSLIVDNPEETYRNQNEIWVKFEKIFSTLSGILNYKPVFEAYLYDVLQEFYDDNVMYLEVRSGLSMLYDLNEKSYDRFEVAKIMKAIVEKFKTTHKNFFGFKIIVSTHRNQENEGVRQRAQLALDLSNLHPNFIAGFDLVGYEDKGKPLSDYKDILLQYSGQLKYFFHAGETNWFGYPADHNLFDAILLNTTRIGHGFSALKHPEILRKIKDAKIPLEICPISNQVLMLVSDLRNHPANFYISKGIPIVIGSDDPSFWGAVALSHDWYYAFMAMSCRETDLRFLEKLAINSIIASALTHAEKIIFLNKWKEQWRFFIEDLIKLQL
ncbi:hypothetical protein HHI36_018705 [Cryptolaemus montrouzieri]|uniref:Adenosine deaminase n=1 Tax=Cryptolaemus montrouzieri TaxID=559131 RepID=A0ABD2P0R2_9CUCU